jgi:hypothetical protein
MRLAFTRLVDTRIRISARAPKILNVPEQVSVSVLYSQMAEVNTDNKKHSRRLASGPTFDGKTSYQDKPTTVEHFVEQTPQTWTKRR